MRMLLLMALLASLLALPTPISRAAPTISPSQATIALGEPLALSLSGGEAATWSIVSGSGAISPLGVFSAPAISETVVIRAETSGGSAEATILVREWAVLADAPLPALSVNTLEFGPDGLLYAGTEGAGLFSLDLREGGIWRPLRGSDGGITPSGNGVLIKDQAFDQAGNHYAATNSGIYRRPVGRTYWERLETGLPSDQARTLANALLLVNEQLYAGFSNGSVWRWDLRSGSWSPVGQAPASQPIYALAHDGISLFAGTRGYVAFAPLSSAANVVWGQFPPVNEWATSLTVFNGTLYAGVRNRGLLAFDGSAWQTNGRFLGNPQVFGGRLFAQGGSLSGQHLFVLEAGSWQPLTTSTAAVPGNSGAQAFTIGPDGSAYIGRQDGVYRTQRGLAMPALPTAEVSGVSISPSALEVRLGTSRSLSALPAALPLAPSNQRLFLPLISLAQANQTIRYGLPGGVFWQSDNVAVASVDPSGLVTGHAVGSATITAIARDDLSQFDRVTVTVVDPGPSVRSLAIRSLPSDTVEVSATISLYANLRGSTLNDAVGVLWSIEPSDRASIDRDGVVRGLAPGVVTVTATARADANLRATQTITVVEAARASLPTGGAWVNITAGLPPNPRENEQDQGLRTRALAWHNGRLFLGTNGREIWAWDGSSWMRVAAPGALGAYLPSVSALLQPNDGNLYAQAGNRFFRYISDNEWQPVDTGLPSNTTFVESSVLSGTLTTVAVRSSGVQLYQFDLVSETWATLGAELALTMRNPVGGIAAANGQISLGGKDGNVYRLQPDGGWLDVSANLPKPQSESNPGGVNAPDIGIVIVRDAPDGSLYVISDSARNKLYRLAPEATTWELVVSYAYQQGAGSASAWLGDSLYLGGQQRVLRVGAGEREELGIGYGPAPDIRIYALASPDGGRSLYAAGDGPLGSSVWWISPDPSAPVQISDLAVSTASYLGNSPEADDATAAEIGRDGAIIIAGRSQGREEYGQEAINLLGGGDGLITRFDRSGRVVLSRTRLGRAIFDLEVDRGSGRMAVASDLGVSLLSASADRVIWHVPLSGVERVAIGADGTVVALAQKEVLVLRPEGSIRARTTIVKSFVTDVAVHAASGSIYVVGFNNQTLASGLPVQSAFLYSFDYDLGFKWKNWDFTGSELTGNEADTRAYRVAIGRDEMLYYLGETAGGNTVYRWQPRDLGTSGNLISYDDYSSGVNSASAHFGYVARLNPASGAVLAGQFAVPRLSDGTSNTYRMRAVAADEAGNVYLGGTAAFAIASRDANRIAGQPLATYSGGDGAILVLSPDFRTRRLWTAWSAGGIGHSTVIRGIAASNGVAVIAATAEGGRLLTHAALPNGAQPSSALRPYNPDGFYSVWETR